MGATSATGGLFSDDVQRVPCAHHKYQQLRAEGCLCRGGIGIIADDITPVVAAALGIEHHAGVGTVSRETKSGRWDVKMIRDMALARFGTAPTIHWTTLPTSIFSFTLTQLQPYILILTAMKALA